MVCSHLSKSTRRSLINRRSSSRAARRSSTDGSAAFPINLGFAVLLVDFCPRRRRFRGVRGFTIQCQLYGNRFGCQIRQTMRGPGSSHQVERFVGKFRIYSCLAKIQSGTVLPHSKTWPSVPARITRLRFGVRRCCAAFRWRLPALLRAYHFRERCDQSLIFLHRADRNAKPLG